jgi:hypothetical protein
MHHHFALIMHSLRLTWFASLRFNTASSQISTVSEDAEIDPRTVATLALAVRRSNHSAIQYTVQYTMMHLIHNRLHLIHTRLYLIHTRLHLIHTRLWSHLHSPIHFPRRVFSAFPFCLSAFGLPVISVPVSPEYRSLHVQQTVSVDCTTLPTVYPCTLYSMFSLYQKLCV